MGYGRSYDIGVFGSNFGHTVTQNLPVLLKQNYDATAYFYNWSASNLNPIVDQNQVPFTLDVGPTGAGISPDGLHPVPEWIHSIDCALSGTHIRPTKQVSCRRWMRGTQRFSTNH